LPAARNIVINNSTNILKTGALCHGIISGKKNKKGSVRKYVLHAITFVSAQQISMREYLLVQSKENLFLKETTYLKGVIIG
tara:strand:+ start:1268 stop:1510 length:243 start_codon:yes stop_codon:yes gene_type:complete